jgi:hypothetical protein
VRVEKSGPYEASALISPRNVWRETAGTNQYSGMYNRWRTLSGVSPVTQWVKWAYSAEVESECFLITAQ